MSEEFRFANNLRYKRIAAGITQTEISKATGVTQSKLSRMETENWDKVNLGDALKVAKYFETTVDDLFKVLDVRKMYEELM